MSNDHLLDAGLISNHVQSGNRDVRSRLRQWQSENKAASPLLPEEPSTLDNSNNLTRPSTGQEQPISDEEYIEGLDSYVEEFDRIVEVPANVDHSTRVMRRGDLVELPTAAGGGSNMNLCIFVGLKDEVYQYMSITGQVYVVSYRSATYVVPSFIDPKMLEPIIPHLPQDLSAEGREILRKKPFGVPTNVAAPILEKIRQFRDEAAAEFRSHASAIDNAHEILAHPTNLQLMCLEDIVTKITGISENDGQSPALLFAVSTALLRGEWGFSVDPKTYAESRIMAVESAKSRETVRRVQDWVQAYEEEMALTAGGYQIPEDIARKSLMVKKFARKARALTLESRKIRYTTPEGTVLTCKPEHAKDAEDSDSTIHSLRFSNTDRDFINYMGMHTSSRLFYYHQQLRSLPSILLRAIDAYPGRALDLDFSHTLLVEMGVTQPYDNPFALDRDVFTPHHNVESDVEAMQDRVDAGVSAFEAGNLHDSMSGFRKDWGDLPVFCIDSKATLDRDDGISIEDIEGSNGEYWFHSHIAHISAFTKPDHVLGQHAETRGSAIYLPDSRIAMFPDWVAMEFSLAPNKPVITFSARLNSEGDILETKIQPGFIRNVHPVPYEMLDEALDYHDTKSVGASENLLVIKVGSHKSQENSAPTFDFKPPTANHTILLKRLYKMAQKSISKRPQTPFGMFASRDAVHAHGLGYKMGPASFSTDQELSHAKFSLLNPTIEWTINKNYDADILNFEDHLNRPSKIVVQEAMLLTGIIAARWSAERNIPIVYYGTRAAVDGLEDFTKVLRQQVIELGNGKHGWDRRLMSNVISLYALRHLATYPLEHRLLGFTQYTKITSPLRRYMDLVSLWQIDAALREEASSGISLVGRKDMSYLALSSIEVNKILRLQDTRMKRSSKYASAHTKHWTTLCLARAHYLNEAKLPDPLTALVSKAGAQRQLARLEQLEMSCDLVEGLGENGDRPVDGDIWEVSISSIIPFDRKVKVKPIRKIGTFAGRALERAAALADQ